MAFTDEDEKDLKAVVNQRKDRPVTSFLKDSPEYKRQFGKGAAKDSAAKSMGSTNPSNAAAMKEAGMKCGGTVKKYAKGGSIDGIAQRGKTRGKYI